MTRLSLALLLLAACHSPTAPAETDTATVTHPRIVCAEGFVLTVIVGREKCILKPPAR